MTLTWVICDHCSEFYFQKCKIILLKCVLVSWCDFFSTCCWCWHNKSDQDSNSENCECTLSVAGLSVNLYLIYRQITRINFPIIQPAAVVEINLYISVLNRCLIKSRAERPDWWRLKWEVRKNIDICVCERSSVLDVVFHWHLLYSLPVG